MAVVGVGAIMLRGRWLSQFIIRPLNGWRRCSSSSLANSSAQGTDSSKKLRTSFMLFVDERKKVQGLPEFRNIIERAKYFSEQWKQLSEQDKERYKTIAAQNLAAYYDDQNKEMPEQLALQKEQKRVRAFQMHAKSLKKERELNQMPQRPYTAYAHFISEMAKSERRGDAPRTDFIRGASQQWKLMAAEDRQPYINAAAEQRAKYEADMNNWEKRMEAEGKGHLIPGREPSLNIPRKSPFAQAVIKVVEATTKEALTKNAVNGILTFIGEKLSTIEKADQLDAQQIIHDFALEWVHLQPIQRKRYCPDPTASDASAARGDQRPDDEAHEVDSKDIKHSPSKRSIKGTGSAPSASTADGNEREPAKETTASALKQKGTRGRPRKEPVGKSDAETAQVDAVETLQTKTSKSEVKTADEKPPRPKQKRRPVDSNTTSDDSD